MALEIVFLGKINGALLFSITGLAGMIVDMSDIEYDVILKKKMEEGGRIDPSREGKENSPLFQKIKMEELRHYLLR